MTSTIFKSYAKKSNKKVSEVEILWDRSEKLIKEEYENIEVGSDRYYSLVNGVVKQMLQLEEAYLKLKKFNSKYDSIILKLKGNENYEDI